MLQTVQITGYSEAKEYALKQARVLQKEKDPKSTSLDLAEDGEEQVDKRRTMKKVKFEDDQNDEETYTHDELLAWIGKGPGKGGKGNGKNGSKGKFEGNCHYCGVYGHRISECRKKDSDMKGMGKGYDSSLGSGWGFPNQNNGKGMGYKGTWGPAKGSYGKGGKWGVWFRRRLERRW